MMPEEFPVILTIFLALGAWRISQRRVLTRRTAAIEALGSATVLCVDKTGTLTENRMTVAVLAVDGALFDLRAHRGEPLPEEFHALAEFALLASQQNPFDPMERAINALAKETLSGTEHLHDNWTLVHEYPLSHELLAMTHVWRPKDGDGYVIGAEGRPGSHRRPVPPPAGAGEGAPPRGGRSGRPGIPGAGGGALGASSPASFPRASTTSRSSFWASWRWPTRSARECPDR